MATDVESMLDYLVANLGIDRERINFHPGSHVSITGDVTWLNNGLRSDDSSCAFHRYVSYAIHKHMKHWHGVDVSVSVSTGCGTDTVTDASGTCGKCGSTVKRLVKESKSGDRLTRLCCPRWRPMRGFTSEVLSRVTTKTCHRPAAHCCNACRDTF